MRRFILYNFVSFVKQTRIWNGRYVRNDIVRYCCLERRGVNLKVSKPYEPQSGKLEPEAQISLMLNQFLVNRHPEREAVFLLGEGHGSDVSED